MVAVAVTGKVMRFYASAFFLGMHTVAGLCASVKRIPSFAS